MSNNNTVLFKEIKEFYDKNPCDGQANVHYRMKFRYKKEPWLPIILNEIAQYRNILEIGCGQGTDSLYCCQKTSEDVKYIAIDLSLKSIENAMLSVKEIMPDLRITPLFQIGNAEHLAFPDNTFDCVVSLGVLHHTPSLEQSLDEIFRVLKSDGIAIISLYRRLSPKLLIAHSLRLVFNCFNKMTIRKELMPTAFKKLANNHKFGTMFHECFEVPILRSYTKGSLKRKFDKFRRMEIKRLGVGLPLFNLNPWLDNKLKIFGAQWLIRAFK